MNIGTVVEYAVLTQTVTVIPVHNLVNGVLVRVVFLHLVHVPSATVCRRPTHRISVAQTRQVLIKCQNHNFDLLRLHHRFARFLRLARNMCRSRRYWAILDAPRRKNNFASALLNPGKPFPYFAPVKQLAPLTLEIAGRLCHGPSSSLTYRLFVVADRPYQGFNPGRPAQLPVAWQVLCLDGDIGGRAGRRVHTPVRMTAVGSPTGAADVHTPQAAWQTRGALLPSRPRRASVAAAAPAARGPRPQGTAHAGCRAGSTCSTHI